MKTVALSGFFNVY